MEEVEDYFDNVKTGLNNLWIGIKSNNQKIINGEQDEMLFDVVKTMQELAQVGAVLRKIENTLEVEE